MAVIFMGFLVYLYLNLDNDSETNFASIDFRFFRYCLL